MSLITLTKTIINTPYKERSHIFSTISMVGNFFLAIVKFVAAILIGSIFISAGGFATLSLGIAKYYYFKSQNENKPFTLVLIILLIFSFIYIVTMLLQILYTHEIDNIGLIPGISVATVSFVEIGTAIFGFTKAMKFEEKSFTILKSINLCSAMTAIVLTQSVLITINGEGIEHYMYDSLFGIGIGIVCIIITLVLMMKTVGYKSEEVGDL